MILLQIINGTVGRKLDFGSDRQSGRFVPRRQTCPAGDFGRYLHSMERQGKSACNLLNTVKATRLAGQDGTRSPL